MSKMLHFYKWGVELVIRRKVMFHFPCPLDEREHPFYRSSVDRVGDWYVGLAWRGFHLEIGPAV